MMQSMWRNGLMAGLVALCLFFPISGLVLDGYTFNAHPSRPIIIAAVVILGRVLLDLLRRIKATRAAAAGEQGQRRSAAVHDARAPRLAGQSRALPYALTATVIAVGVAFPFVSDKYWLSVLIGALIYVLLGLGLNIVVGLAGLLDLGFVAFYAVGAYGFALGAQYFGLGFWLALPLCALAASVCGAILAFPVLRMHGDYLAIVTLGFGEIIRLVLNNWMPVTGGPNGVYVPVPTLFGLEFARSSEHGGRLFHEFLGVEYSSVHRYMLIYFSLLVAVLMVMWLVHRLRSMPMGQAWEALREDEIACRSLGLNHVTVKLSAFALGAGIGGLAGVFFAAFQGFINPSSFTFLESALILAMVVLGGLGSIKGVVTAALVLSVTPELLRDFTEYRILIFGILMVVVMLWRPKGLLQGRRPRYELPDPEGGGLGHDRQSSVPAEARRRAFETNQEGATS